ncbi:LexA family transcriptional regulator [Jeotgalibacillus soli]|uniref:HTH cro/C1-type domain-containing protein n=1 Tax=Jeotgalibacillus soli TaxID=889306 RepID=A0A0C2R644_9BACL|nr:XRE family transcriptional regulator [Jeotgalibacillus soli]KIL45730.1 hypothetical protein KP78_20790 [Jeotgalibacillus soli]
MRYNDLLNKYIKQSQLSLREISRRSKDKGHSVSQAYISQLLKGDTPPPSKEVSIVIAEITGGDPDNLLLAAYLEKAPDHMKEFFNNFDVENYRLLNNTLNNMKESVYENEEEFVKDRRKSYYDNCPDDLKEEFLEKTDTPEKFLNFTKKPNKIMTAIYKNLGFDFEKETPENIIKKINQQMVNFNNSIDAINQEKAFPAAISIPLIKNIPSNAPVFSKLNIEGYIDLANPAEYQENDLIILNVNDPSMSGSRIYSGDKAVVKIKTDFEDGDLVVVNIDDQHATLRKIKKLIDDQLLLTASNDQYEPIIIHKDKVRIIGKVIQVIFEP